MGLFDIKIGTEKRKRSKFNLDSTTSFTAEFGEVYPSFYHQLDKDDSVHFKPQSFIRLSPLVVPTFSKSVTYKSYISYVPYNEVWEGFDFLLSNKPTTTSFGTASYSTCPQISVRCLSALVLSQMKWTMMSSTDTDVTSTYFLSTGAAFVGSLPQSFLPTLVRFICGKPNDTIQECLQRQYYNSNKNAITPDNADYMFCIEGEPSGHAAIVLFKHTPKSKRLYSILVGLGYKLDIKNTTTYVSLLPILSYYKAWFDLFNPQRNITWTDTECYYLSHYMYDTHYCNVGFGTAETEYFNKFYRFFDDELSDCWYIYEPDYYSMQLRQLNAVDDQLPQPGGSYVSSSPTHVPNAVGPAMVGNPQSVSVTIDYENNQVKGSNLPTLNGVVTRPGLQILNKFAKYINKNTIIGGKLREFLLAHGLGNGDNLLESNFLGKFSVPIMISDINATASSQTSDGGFQPLGDYTGKGIGSGESSVIKYTAKNCGILLCLSTVVPALGYVQGIQPYLKCTQKWSFYHPEFDSLGAVSTNVDEILSNTECTTSSYVSNTLGFGFIPRYADLKVKNNVLFGDFFNRGFRASMLPYTMDRFIQPYTSQIKLNPSGSYDIESHYMDRNNLVASSNWRYLGKYPWMSNYNRIFTDSHIVSDATLGTSESDDLGIAGGDHFIIHQINNLSMVSPKVPLSESFDTAADDESTITVQKS